MPGGKGEAGRKDGAGEEAGGRTSCWVDAKRVALRKLGTFFKVQEKKTIKASSSQWW